MAKSKLGATYAAAVLSLTLASAHTTAPQSPQTASAQTNRGGTPEMVALTGIDVAFLPMNQPYTMTPEQAADAVKAFRPKVVYPYHDKGTDPQKLADLVGSAAEVRVRDWYATP